ncbi:MAG: glycosyltransferase family 4 protein [Paracoccaceae bacterium]
MTTLATASIFHHPDAVESDDKPLAGRRTAGQSFLAGYARHVQADKLHCVAQNQAHIDHFCELIQDYGWEGEVTGAMTHQPAALGDPGVVFLPGPGLGAHAWPRRRVGQRIYSLCGITHTVSTRRIMEGLFDSLTGPVEEWDAIICTSDAVHSVVKAELDEADTYLRRRFGARRVPRPQLPVIPLGIDTSRFARSDSLRAKWRREYEVPEDGIVVMSMGRLTVFEKMHPAPLFIALENAARTTEVPITLLMVGWFGDDATEKLHREAAARLAPSVRIEFPNGRDADLRYEIWSAADIFTLPVDNIQETYGLAPVEAMAAGLPVVCSDWDGFKDTIVDSETGIRVRTLFSRGGFGRTIAERFEDGRDSYLQYLGFVQQRTVVDIPEMTVAFVNLIQNPDLRARMGAAGKARARQLYDWEAIIPQYQALWGELNARRSRGIPSSPREGDEAANPSGMDPFRLYARYPTDAITNVSVLSADRAVSVDEVQDLVVLTGAAYLKRLVTAREHIAMISEMIHRDGPIRLDQVIEASGLSPGGAEGAVLWLAKFGLVRITV